MVQGNKQSTPNKTILWDILNRGKANVRRVYCLGNLIYILLWKFLLKIFSGKKSLLGSIGNWKVKLNYSLEHSRVLFSLRFNNSHKTRCLFYWNRKHLGSFLERHIRKSAKSQTDQLLLFLLGDIKMLLKSLSHKKQKNSANEKMLNY